MPARRPRRRRRSRRSRRSRRLTQYRNSSPIASYGNRCVLQSVSPAPSDPDRGSLSGLSLLLTSILPSHHEPLVEGDVQIRSWPAVHLRGLRCRGTVRTRSCQRARGSRGLLSPPTACAQPLEL